MSKSQRDLKTVDKFRDFIEAIEIARDFLIPNTPLRVRLALIALDNTAELLMAQISGYIFTKEEFYLKILRTRFSQSLKTKTFWDFGAKTELMESESILGRSEAALLDLGHSYRNPAYHQGLHNPRSIRAVSILLLQPIATLLKVALSGISLSDADIAWLRDHGIFDVPFSLEKAVPIVIAKLTEALREPLDTIKTISAKI